MTTGDLMPSREVMPTFVVTGELLPEPRPQTADVLKALRRSDGLVRWDRAVRLVASRLDLPRAEAERALATALRDPRRLLVGVISRETDAFFVRVSPRAVT